MRRKLQLNSNPKSNEITLTQCQWPTNKTPVDCITRDGRKTKTAEEKKIVCKERQIVLHCNSQPDYFHWIRDELRASFVANGFCFISVAVLLKWPVPNGRCNLKSYGFKCTFGFCLEQKKHPFPQINFGLSNMLPIAC